MALTALTGNPATNAFVFAGNPVIFRYQCSAALADHRVVVRPFILIESTIYDLPETYTEPDGSLIATFNLSEVLTKAFDRIIEALPGPGNTIEELKKSIGYVGLYVTEVGGTPVATEDEVIEYLYAIRGGIAWHHAPTLQYLDVYQPTNKLFLSWQPNGQRVTPDQYVYLPYLQRLTDTTWAVEVKSYDESGVLLGTLTPFSVSGATIAVINAIPAGFTQLGIAAQAYAGSVARYTVQVKNGGTAYSELRTFYLDRKYYRNVRYFQFTNSIGGFDSIYTTGETEQVSELNRQTVEVYQPNAYVVGLGQRRAREFFEQDIFKVNTGYALRPELDNLRAALLSGKIGQLLQIRTSSGSTAAWVPVEIVGSQIKRSRDNEFLHFLELEMRYLFVNAYHTPAP